MAAEYSHVCYVWSHGVHCLIRRDAVGQALIGQSIYSVGCGAYRMCPKLGREAGLVIIRVLARLEIEQLQRSISPFCHAL